MKNKRLLKKISGIDTVLICSGLVGIAIMMFMWQADEYFAKQLTREDGLIENLSALFFLLGFMICVYYMVKIKSLKSKSFLVLWALLCFFFLGEETSWFQRILQFSTPEAIKNINAQEEFNFHNLKWIQGGEWDDAIEQKQYLNYKLLLSGQNMFRIGFFTYFFCFPLLGLSVKLRGMFESLNFPLPRSLLVISIWVTILLSFFLAMSSSKITGKALAETREMTYALFIFLYLLTHAKGVIHYKELK